MKKILLILVGFFVLCISLCAQTRRDGELLFNEGRYEEAYEAATQVKRLLPTTDHEFDMFGVGIHNTWLMERLEDAMRR